MNVTQIQPASFRPVVTPTTWNVKSQLGLVATAVSKGFTHKLTSLLTKSFHHVKQSTIFKNWMWGKFHNADLIFRVHFVKFFAKVKSIHFTIFSQVKLQVRNKCILPFYNFPVYTMGTKNDKLTSFLYTTLFRKKQYVTYHNKYYKYVTNKLHCCLVLLHIPPVHWRH